MTFLKCEVGDIVECSRKNTLNCYVHHLILKIEGRYRYSGIVLASKNVAEMVYSTRSYLSYERESEYWDYKILVKAKKQ